MNKVIIAIDKSKSYRVYLTVTTEMVEEARGIHDTTPLATAMLGRVLTGAGLMGLMLKNDKDKVTVLFKGEGEAKQVLVTADGKGSVKGYIANPYVNLPLKEDGKLDVGGAIGIGELTVIKDIGLKEPYIGNIALVTGEVADDLTAYFFISEQQNSSVALGVKISKDMKVASSGGMIIQMLPGYEEEAVDELEKMLEEMPSISSLIAEEMLKSKGKTEEGILKSMLDNIFKSISDEYKPEIIDTKEMKWDCDCSKERYTNGLKTLNEKELTEMIDDDGGAEVVCQFCRKKYLFSTSELEEIRKEVGRDDK